MPCDILRKDHWLRPEKGPGPWPGTAWFCLEKLLRRTWQAHPSRRAEGEASPACQNSRTPRPNVPDTLAGVAGRAWQEPLLPPAAASGGPGPWGGAFPPA